MESLIQNLKQKCMFYKADLSNVEFKGTEFHSCNFDRSDCYETIFRNSKIINCLFTGILLSKVDFTNAYMEHVDFRGAYVKETIFSNVTIKSILGIDEAFIKSINIGTTDEPQMLYGDEAKQWLMNRAKKVL